MVVPTSALMLFTAMVAEPKEEAHPPARRFHGGRGAVPLFLGGDVHDGAVIIHPAAMEPAGERRLVPGLDACVAGQLP